MPCQKAKFMHNWDICLFPSTLLVRDIMEKILVTGGMGQIGSELVKTLRQQYGDNNVIASDYRIPPHESLQKWEPFEFLDVTKRDNITDVIQKHKITVIYHLAAILSAVGEQNPHLAWSINMSGLYNILESAREHKLTKLFYPSSIAAFGPETPRDKTPQETILQPTTMYGITKVSGELLCNYYTEKLGMDIRGVRFPGIISSETLPGGGTTDYAVAIFYEAIKQKKYQCFVRKDTVLPMMYMPDAIKAMIELMKVEKSCLQHHSNFNLASMSFSVEELAQEIKKHIPEFECTYAPDFRQEIADSWPRSIDDSAARNEWGWIPDFDLASMTQDMLAKLSRRHELGML